MAIRKVWAVYAKTETSYGDNTYNNITAADFIHAFGDTVDVQIDSDVFEYLTNVLSPIKTGQLLETARTVKFSFEVPIKWASTNPEIARILTAAGATGSNPYTVSGSDSSSLALRFVSDQKYVVVVRGAKVRSVEFILKPNEYVIAKVEGIGLFQSESITSDTLSPTVSYSSIIKAYNTTLTGDLSGFVKEASIKITNNLHVAKNFTSQYGVGRIFIASTEISSSFTAETESLNLKYPQNTLSINATFLQEGSSTNKLVFSFTSPVVKTRKNSFDDVMYSDVEFIAGGLSIQFTNV